MIPRFATLRHTRLDYAIEPRFFNRASIFQCSLDFSNEPRFFNRGSYREKGWKGRVVSVWVECTEQMIAGALIAQRLNKTEGRKASLGASVISCQKKPQTSCEWEMNRWNARKHRG